MLLNRYSVFFLIFHFLTRTVPTSTAPDHFFKASKSPKPEAQEFFELSNPLPSDRLTPSCSITVIRHSFANTINLPPYSTSYSPPSDCPTPWPCVVLELRVSSSGDQYDRIAGIWLDGAEILRTSTAEPTESGIYWRVRKDITRYSSILSKPQVNVTMMLENVVNDVYTGVYHVHVSFLYYKENVRPYEVKIPSIISPNENSHSLGTAELGLFKTPADLIIPISDDGERGNWFRVESEADVHERRVRIPKNTHQLVLELYVSFHGNDEFWYSNPPNSYIQMNNLTTERGNGAYREVFVTVDGKFVGSEVAFPVVFTGGVNPLFWEPVVAIGAFNLPSYDLDLTPFLGWLLDGKEHEFRIAVDDAISFWLVNANLHIWLDHGTSKLEAQSVVYNNPALVIRRDESFSSLDGTFKIKAKRKSEFAGWVKSKAGNFTTIVSQEFILTNSVRFYFNGTDKIVQQDVKAKRDSRIRADSGNLVGRTVIQRRYPLTVITSTVPLPRIIDSLDSKKEEMYMQVTNVSHSLNEKRINGNYSSILYNKQKSEGWMKVKDHDVLSGEATTWQRYKFRDEFGCYSRTVLAYNGELTSDNTTFNCAGAAST
ncbi:Peptide-N4-(N-acetyl-beta-glucosaminyl)asparagine amidase A [Corchorus capsularis]|uniref:Peptide-N4-(N-acetyl-beta-glucosaminyl)asparagine amidase A n=1 Tax=Corchorus capsularis TaxID=210143 RepID=A0A1R3FW22_COCAP|nr:Peptide-N4-(N-acetyl-beta-glucosaminyl)asparagine amidase A [Corchorus capsularis]